MSIKKVSIAMIILSAVSGLLQIILCKAWSCGFYTISTAFVWWVVYALDKSCSLVSKALGATLEYIELLESRITELTKNDTTTKTE